MIDSPDTSSDSFDMGNRFRAVTSSTSRPGTSEPGTPERGDGLTRFSVFPSTTSIRYPYRFARK